MTELARIAGSCTTTRLIACSKSGGAAMTTWQGAILGLSLGDCEVSFAQETSPLSLSLRWQLRRYQKLNS